MSWAVVVAAGITATVEITKSVQANNRAKEQAQLAKEAQEELDKAKDQFEALDTSNPYLNMENVYEDLTVNKQAAEFERSQMLQSQANTMNQMRAAAGSSGIAALAQTLANTGAIAAQKTSASIAAQEQQNMLKERAEESRLQGLEREGEIISRQAEMGIIQSMMGMSADEINVARQAEMLAIQQAQQAQAQAIQSGGQAVAGTLRAEDVIDQQQYDAAMQQLGGTGSASQYELFNQWLASQGNL
tara:strand:+ start:12124 stop:12858 length:735 start_codon:yes stop_codon:yes gene_type:complete